MLGVIAAIAQDGVIGKDGDLPWGRIPADLCYFKSITTGHPVVMGRKTFESIVRRLGKPLPDRLNVVLTRNQEFAVHPGCIAIHDLSGLEKLDFPEAYVIGGEEIYHQMLPKASHLFLTNIYASFEGDSYFPEFGIVEWECISSTYMGPNYKSTQYSLEFSIWRRRYGRIC